MTARIENIASVERVIGRWSPGDLAFIERLCLETAECETTSLTVTALFQRSDLATSWPDVDRPFARVTLEFEGVRDLSLKGMGGGPGQIMGFYIDDVSGDGLEGIRFNVGDYEDGRISFLCRAITVVEAAPVETPAQGRSWLQGISPLDRRGNIARGPAKRE